MEILGEPVGDAVMLCVPVELTELPIEALCEAVLATELDCVCDRVCDSVCVMD